MSYKKNDPYLFDKIDLKREIAKSNVRKLLKRQQNNSQADPYTDMLSLIEYLESFKAPN